MLSQESLRELSHSWLPNITDDGLDRGERLAQDSQPWCRSGIDRGCKGLFVSHAGRFGKDRARGAAR